MGMLAKPRRILITGASLGIGRAAARELARRGHRVVLAARNAQGLAEVAARIEADGGKCEVAAIDVTDDESVSSCIEQVLDRGPVDVLVNNAGSLQQTEFRLQSDKDRRAEMELNYFGALRMIEALLPPMIAAGGGQIVNVTSILGSVGTATTANYGATKAALATFSHALRGEVERFGIHVTLFVPPHTQTGLGERADFRGVRSSAPELVGKGLVCAIDQAPRCYAVGSHLRTGLRLAALLPSFMEAQLAKSVRHLLP